MKILFWQWHSFMNKGIENALKRLEIEYEVFFYQLSNWEQDDVFSQKFSERLTKGYDLVLSVNFCPLISDVCNENGIRYISWIYDSPIHIRNLAPMKNGCNEIYLFDRGQVEEYQKQGIAVNHLPLAVDTDVFKPFTAYSGSFSSKISFVGQLYHTDYSMYSSPLSGYLHGYLNSILDVQKALPSVHMISEMITDDLLFAINSEFLKLSNNTFQIERRELEYMLACECTYRERYNALTKLIDISPVDLYTNSTEGLPGGISLHGYVDYYTQMPSVFANSMVNLNMSLQAIRTGVPLRVIDILGCGGFVMTNVREELYEFLSPGENCETYTSIEELCDKCAFYLEHEDERKKITVAGFETAKRDFTFDDRLKIMLGR